MPRINLLPWREQQRTERKKSFAVGMIGAVIAALIVTGAGYVLMNSLIDGQASRNQRLAEEIKILDKKIEEINSFEQQKRQTIARMQIIEKLQRSRPETVHVFDTLVKTVPEGIYLTSIAQSGQNFKIQGVTQSPTRVSTFLRELAASEWLRQPDIADDGINLNRFTVVAKQVTSLADAPAAAPRKTTAGAK
jgi:type IV pilus assembly protein PilN